MEKGYMISDAAKLVEVENHVLRYWEEELELPIPRNEMGHRFYRESDIKLLRSVKDLKEQGFQLRAIKKLLPDLGKLEHMDAQDIYQLREELNGQVFQETMERAMDHSKASVTSLNQARYEKRQKTWQERSYELEQNRMKPTPALQEAQKKASLERLHQFEAMMRQMIRSTMEEMSRESEDRICEEVTTRLQKEMNYLLMRKEELQEKQIGLLQEILAQVRQEEGGTDGPARKERTGKAERAGRTENIARTGNIVRAENIAGAENIAREEDSARMQEEAGREALSQDAAGDGGEWDGPAASAGEEAARDVAVTAEEMAETKRQKKMRLKKEKKRKKLFSRRQSEDVQMNLHI